MQVAFAIIATLLAIVHFFRWFIVIFITLAAMIGGGFFFGLGTGFLTWIVIKSMYYFVFIVCGYTIISELEGKD